MPCGGYGKETEYAPERRLAENEWAGGYNGNIVGFGGNNVTV
jgi:hypothetical protein